MAGDVPSTSMGNLPVGTITFGPTGTIDTSPFSFSAAEPMYTTQVRNQIWITFRKEGMHKYPAALTDPTLATGDRDDVSFLGHFHRHIFHFKVWIDVNHNDRDIEFIQFKRWVERLYSEDTLSLNFKSCEMMADDLHAQIVVKYPGRSMSIEISEDGENGCLKTYTEQRIP